MHFITIFLGDPQEFEHFKLNSLQRNIAKDLLHVTFSYMNLRTGFIRESLQVLLLAYSFYHFQGSRELSAVLKEHLIGTNTEHFET